MPQNPSPLSRFWNELKRRNVLRVITVYAAAAFIILDLTEIVAPSMGLPGWTINLVFILLCVGFVITVILSWIYDMHPENGVVKTNTQPEPEQTQTSQAGKGWKIASYVSFGVILGLLLLNLFRGDRKTRDPESVEMSIAVLPFRNDSPNEERMYFIDGTMDAILNHLCKIKDLRVPGRTSVEQYRGSLETIPDIASELNVSYILGGSGQKLGKRILLTVQLHDGINDQLIWSKSYDREINEIEDLLDIPREVAKMAALEVEAIITPEEIDLIERPMALDLNAWDFYQQGNEEYWKYKTDRHNREALNRAGELYHRALEIDADFALAYTGLARVYWQKQYWDSYFSDSFLDSVLILSDKALSLDHRLSDAYTIRGDYYREKAEVDKAITAYDRAIQLNPNDWSAYYGRGWAYRPMDVTHSYRDFLKAASLNRGKELIFILESLSLAYAYMGFFNLAEIHYKEAYRFEGSEDKHYFNMARVAFWKGRYEESLALSLQAYKLDSLNLRYLEYIANNYDHFKQYDKSLIYYKKWKQRIDETGVARVNAMHRLGFAYWKNGLTEEAETYFNQQMDYCKAMNTTGRTFSQMLWTYYDLAAVYAFRGEKKQAFENLRILNQKEVFSLWIPLTMESDPLFDGIRAEPEFQAIQRDIRSKYEREHQRVRLWLEENGLL